MSSGFSLDANPQDEYSLCAVCENFIEEGAVAPSVVEFKQRSRSGEVFGNMGFGPPCAIWVRG